MSSLTPVFENPVSRREVFAGLVFRAGPLFLLVAFLTACGTQTRVLGQNEHYLVLLAGQGETPKKLASAFLGNPEEGWRIEDANGGSATIKAGQQLVIPRKASNSTGVFDDGYQTIPILSYHRFGDGKGKLSVTRRQFEEQMEYLRSNGFRVISFRQLLAFLREEAELPRRSVVLTIDDGYRSVYDIAYPVLKRYRYPATIFIYSDFIGKGGLNWRQMAEMEATGLISFQAHSKTHGNLTVRHASESMDDYEKRLTTEVRTPSKLLKKRVKSPQLSFAYPFGAVNQKVVDELERSGYEVGVTVDRGANPFFVFPYALRRIMIYEKDGMPEFKKALMVFEPRDLN